MAPRVLEQDLGQVTEGTTTFWAPKSEHERGPKAKEGVPFYNPVMRLARDLSVLVAHAEAPQRAKPFEVCDAMGSLGARGLRIAHEVPNTHVLVNDVDIDAIMLAKRSADALGRKNVDVRIGRLETVLSDHRFDWVDLDPFGTPAHWLDLAATSVRDQGILAVTATDMPALCGIYPEVCVRRYNARPLHDPVMHEVATRILVGAIARACGRRDRSIVPLLVHNSEHYVRVYVRVLDGAQGANDQVTSFGYVFREGDGTVRLSDRTPAAGDWGGPVWSKPLMDPSFLARVVAGPTKGRSKELDRLLDVLVEEAQAPPFFYTIDEFTRGSNVESPGMDRLLARLHKAGHVATRTHFTPRGIKTDADAPTLGKLVRAAA